MGSPDGRHMLNFPILHPNVSQIHHIETMVPGEKYRQSDLCECMIERTSDPRSRRIIQKAYAESAIHTRHSVLSDFQHDAVSPRLYRNPEGTIRRTASTGERNRIYTEEVKRIVPEVAKRAIENCPSIRAEQITHVITVSCTGFFNPGPDLLLIDCLGLAPTTQRYHLGFMGCYAAFPALRMADQFCRADPSAVVLIVCVELCTIHMQDRDDMDSVVANSVFADGAAAVLVTAAEPSPGSRSLRIAHYASGLAREGMDDMAWDIGDHGFNIVLSKYVSRIIGAGIRAIVDDAFATNGISPDSISKWAVHPGGRSILDKVESSLALRPDHLLSSREILSRYGNMSSATVLFVLADILQSSCLRDGESICAMAFGPGLTIETSILHALVP